MRSTATIGCGVTVSSRDVYVVLDGARVVGASTRLQGAELIRANEADRQARVCYPDPEDDSWWRDKSRRVYDRMCIVNTELQDGN